MCRRCSDDWDDRKRMMRIAFRVLGKEAGEFWLWNATPFPVGLPTWDQIAKALGGSRVQTDPSGHTAKRPR